MKLRLRKIGNSLGVILPGDVITGFQANDLIEVNVITSEPKEEQNVITSANVITPAPEKEANVITGVITQPISPERENGQPKKKSGFAYRKKEKKVVMVGKMPLFCPKHKGSFAKYCGCYK